MKKTIVATLNSSQSSRLPMPGRIGVDPLPKPKGRPGPTSMKNSDVLVADAHDTSRLKWFADKA